MRKVTLLLVVLAGCAPSPVPVPMPAGEFVPALAEFLSMRGYASIPMERMQTGHFRVTAQSGAFPLQLVIDTGAGRTVMDRDVAAQLDVRLREQGGRASGLGGSGQQVALGDLRNLNIGPVALGSMQVAFLDLSHINVGLRQAGQQPIHGVIGADFLLSHRAVLDYQGSVLYVRPEAADR
jgi:hypothetical protein